MTEELIGQEIGGHRLLRFLGRGPHGSSYLVRPQRGPRLQLVLKLLDPQLVAQENLEMWWQAALESAASLELEPVRRLYRIALKHSPPYLLFDYVPGVSLERRLERGPLRPSEAIAILEGALQALYHAHGRQQLHGNIKAGNLVLDPERRGWLLDFGCPWSLWPEQAQLYLNPSSFAPIAPELFGGGRRTPGADLYALGITIWFSCSGQPFPPGGRQIPQPLPLSAIGEFPLPLSGFIDRLIASDPLSRFDDAASALAILREIRAGRGASLLGRALPAPYQPEQSKVPELFDHSPPTHSAEEEEDRRETALIPRPMNPSVAPAPINPLPAPSRVVSREARGGGARRSPHRAHSYSGFLQPEESTGWLDELLTPPAAAAVPTDTLRRRRTLSPLTMALLAISCGSLAVLFWRFLI